MITMIIPPFNPNRVNDQAVYRLVNGEYRTVEAPSFYITQPGSRNLNRRLKHTDESSVSGKGETVDNKFIKASLKEKNLARVSDLEKRLKKESEISNFKARHVHVIGAGTMGKGVATWCALKGIKVTLQDTSEERIKSAIEFAKQYFREINHVESERNLISDHDGSFISDADIVIESIIEVLEAKQSLLKHIETIMGFRDVLALVH